MPSIDPLPVVGGAPAGSLPASFGVSETGSAAYSLDLDVPPGTSGMAPKLGLTYDSRADNSALGTGWALTGLSAITRCAATLAQDGFIDGIDFDSNDRFCLDGQRLVAISGTYGATGTEYRTEHETFSRIHSYGLSGVGPQRFVVELKNGLTYSYGATADSRVEAQGRADVLVWQVDSITDAAGNSQAVTYEEINATGESYPLRIDYTRNSSQGLSPYNSVRLEYEPRSDVPPRYISGSRVQIGKRLTKLAMYTAESRVWEYRLSYETSLGEGKSRLVGVAKCDTLGTCLPATTFRWQEETGGNAVQMTVPISVAGSWGNWTSYPGDYNGDGVTDSAVIKMNSTGYSVWTSLARSDGSFGPGFEAASETGAWANWTPYPGDFNGDGRTDVAAIKMNSTGFAIWMRLARPDGTLAPGFQPLSISGGWSNWTPQLGDFNGDGITDVAAVKMNADGYAVAIYLSRPDGSFQPEIRAFSQPGGWGNYTPYVGDFNGDGITDFAAVKMNSDDYKVYLNLGLGNGVYSPASTLTINEGPSWGNYSPYVGDFNGDGITDFAAIKMNSTGYKVVIHLDRGNGTFGAFTLPVDEPGNWSNFAPFPGDFNGDGVTDLAAIKTASTGHKVWVNMARGDGSFMPGSQPVDVPGGYADYKVKLGDYDGDGVTDIGLVYLGKGGYALTLDTFTATAVDQIDRITNGLGAVTAIEYKPLSDPSVYTKDNDAVYPARDVQGALFVVSAVVTDDGIGGTARQSYRYQGLKLVLDGHGFCGFRNLSRTDETTGLSTTTFYRQDYPFKSRPYRKEVRLADGTLIQRSEDVWSTRSPSPGVSFPYVGQSLMAEYETDGTLIHSATTVRSFDGSGNLTTMAVTHDDGSIETTVNTYADDSVRWHLGRLIRSDVTRQTPGQPSLTRTAAFTYDATSGLLTTETVEPGSPALRRTKSYSRDGFGNILTSTVSGPTIASRTDTTGYDIRGQFVVLSRNALGHTETRGYDASLGKVTTLTGPNQLTTTWERDALGLQEIEHHADGTQVRTLNLAAGTGAPANAVRIVRTDRSGDSPLLVYYDRLDRKIREERVAFGGQKIFVDTRYNAKGEVSQVSEPYLAGDTPLWTVSTYDTVGRLTQVTAPGNRVSTTVYQGRTTLMTDALHQTSTKTIDSRGQLVTSADPQGHAVHYTYDSFGNLIELRDSAGNSTTMQYDVRGNRIQTHDPDSGISTAVYDELGQVIRQTDAKSQIRTFAYDLLGRLVSRSEGEGTSTWTYDTVPRGIGQIGAVSGPGDHLESYSYDDLGRLSGRTTTIGSASYSFGQTYDSYGRLRTLAYPSGFTVAREYNAQGYLEKVVNAATGQQYWRATAVNARGQIESQQLGNGLVATNAYDPATGLVSRIKAGAIQDLSFTFDAVGNLRQRQDLRTGAREDLTYDSLNRLASATVAGQPALTMAYDALGNITNKSDVGAYTYGGSGAGPHAVTSIAGVKANSYIYDANGNRLSSLDGTVEYSTANQPVRITQGSVSLEFSYDAARERYRQVTSVNGVVNKTKVYVGGLYEEESSATSTRRVHFIQGGGTTVAIYTTASGQPDSTVYLHKDHLGSVQTISDELGRMVEVLSFDAWGQRRNASNWSPATTAITASVDRGFGGHEMLDGVKLVHMNGRVYDPVVGRFLSADPGVQEPENQQSLNPYSYVLNNPLSLTDPSGFFFKQIFHALKSLVKNFVLPALAAYIGVQTGLWIAGQLAFAGAAIAETAGLASAGFTTSAAQGILSGGSLSDALRAGVRGAVIQVGTVGIGEGLGIDPQGQIVQQATRVVSQLASGGKLDHRFFSETFYQLAQNVALDHAGDLLKDLTTKDTVLGSSAGTPAEIGGAKSANGAATEAFEEIVTAAGDAPSRTPDPELILRPAEVIGETIEGGSNLGKGALALGERLGLDPRWVARLSPGLKYAGKLGSSLGETVDFLRFARNPTSFKNAWNAFVAASGVIGGPAGEGLAWGSFVGGFAGRGVGWAYVRIRYDSAAIANEALLDTF